MSSREEMLILQAITLLRPENWRLLFRPFRQKKNGNQAASYTKNGAQRRQTSLKNMQPEEDHALRAVADVIISEEH